MKKLALAGVLAMGLAGCSGSEEPQVLNLYNWSEYMPQEVLDRFTEETGIQVVYTTYDSNEAMYARLKLLDESAARWNVSISYASLEVRTKSNTSYCYYSLHLLTLETNRPSLSTFVRF